MKTLPLALVLFAAGLGPFFTASTAQAQVAVYRLDFEKEGTSINYSFYNEGYVIAEAAGGPADWVLTFQEGAQRYYTIVEDFGSLFYPNKGREFKAVLSAAASTGTPQTTFLLIGNPSKDVSSGNVRVKVAAELRGYSLSADDESSVPFDDREGNVGYAGITKVSAHFQEQRTGDANGANLTVEETLTDLLAYLERRGYVEFVVEDPAADDTADNTDNTTTQGQTQAN